ncbi:hypothetical protein CKAH01_06941 [Colletotrichum kahawae]|uniref:Uncharacterized protein n=1 Tax=Colletotrichum kahawae TaxID=34407 RepID=A0AAD9Y794_COLKA|nr:hypothetical protein CKAH01_06941 [Colletotrichum kahawae]
MSVPAVGIGEKFARALRRQKLARRENITNQDAVKSNSGNEDGERAGSLKSPASTRSSRRDDDGLPPKRSRARAPTNTRDTQDNEFRRDTTQKAGKLWSPEEEPLKRKDNTESPRPTWSFRSFEPRPLEADQTEVQIKQPETRPISQEQLVAEVKGIYAGLVMVESKCIEVDIAQSSTGETSPMFNNEQWQALIAMRRKHLHLHHGSSPSQSSSAPKKSHFSSGATDYIVEGSVNGVGIEASPDTGSDECIVSSQLASKLCKTPVSGTEKTITLANKKRVWSPGMIEVLWKFANDQTPHILNCWVLPHSSKEFVLGSRFLKMTGTLTKFFHRVKKVLLPPKLRLRLMGEEKERTMGFFNHRMTPALADTGSDLMLVSSEYVRRHGLTMHSGHGYCFEVELADGTTTYTTGVVRNAAWRIGDSTVRCDFHVLDGLPADVILSKDYLFDLNVFSKYTESFVNVDMIEDISLLCGIRLIDERLHDLEELEEGFLRDVTSREAFDSKAVKNERVRRTLAMRKIATLPLGERPDALCCEENKKIRWDAARAQHKRLWNPASWRSQNAIDQGAGSQGSG